VQESTGERNWIDGPFAFRQPTHGAIVVGVVTAYRAALNKLASAGKPAYGAPAYSRWVNRPLGRRLAALAYVADLTPNQVTYLSGLSSLVGVCLIGWPQPSLPLGAAITIVLLFGYALDSADGQLARLRQESSAAGEWLDHMVDTAKIVLVHGAVLISWLRWEPNVQWSMALIPLGFILASMLAFFGWQLSQLLRRAAGESVAKPAGAPVMRSILRAPSDWGIFVLLFLLWSSPVFLPAYGVLMVVNLTITLVALPVWYRQAQATT
jgi:phosphatidylglycerophosphate synthase